MESFFELLILAGKSPRFRARIPGTREHWLEISEGKWDGEVWWNWERGRGEKGDLVISFPLGLSLFLPVESSYRHPVKKFDQKKWRITRLEKQANNFNTTSLQTDTPKLFMFA